MAPSSKKTDKPAEKAPLPSLRQYQGGLSKMSPENQKRIIEAQRARKAAVAAMPDGGKLGPSAKNKYLWVGTDLDQRVKKQATETVQRQTPSNTTPLKTAIANSRHRDSPRKDTTDERHVRVLEQDSAIVDLTSKRRNNNFSLKDTASSVTEGRNSPKSDTFATASEGYNDTSSLAPSEAESWIENRMKYFEDHRYRKAPEIPRQEGSIDVPLARAMEFNFGF